MGIFNAVFGGFREIRNLEAEKAVLEKENKANKAREEARLEAERRTRREHEDRVESLKREHRREIDELTYEKSRGSRLDNDLVEDAEVDAERKVSQIKEDVKTQIAEANARIEIIKTESASQVRTAKSEAKADALAEWSQTVHELESELASEVSRTSAAVARSEEKDRTIEVLQGMISDYKEFVQFVLNKVPDVDMSNFNINVEMPAPEVHIVGQGKNEKGGDKQEHKKS